MSISLEQYRAGRIPDACVFNTICDGVIRLCAQAPQTVLSPKTLTVDASGFVSLAPEGARAFDVTYAAPETLLGDGPLTANQHYFSLGLLLCYLSEGVPPYGSLPDGVFSYLKDGDAAAVTGVLSDDGLRDAATALLAADAALREGGVRLLRAWMARRVSAQVTLAYVSEGRTVDSREIAAHWNAFLEKGARVNGPDGVYEVASRTLIPCGEGPDTVRVPVVRVAERGSDSSGKAPDSGRRCLGIQDGLAFMPLLYRDGSEPAAFVHKVGTPCVLQYCMERKGRYRILRSFPLDLPEASEGFDGQIRLTNREEGVLVEFGSPDWSRVLGQTLLTLP